MIDIPDIFNVGTPRPIDSRMVKSTLADRDRIPTTLLYDGLECFVEENSKKYRFYKSEWHEEIDLSVFAELADTAIPYGVIAMWSGKIDSIPSGWQLCDGTNNTPDLRDRFVVGAGSKYKVGDARDSVLVEASTTDDISVNNNNNYDIEIVPKFYSLAFIMHMQGCGEGGYVGNEQNIKEAIVIANQYTDSTLKWEELE